MGKIKFRLGDPGQKKGGSRPGGLRFHQLHQLKTIFITA
jgi:hypothetical protein